MRDDEIRTMQSWIMLCQVVRGLFIGGLLLTVLFGGEPSLLEAVVGFISRH